MASGGWGAGLLYDQLRRLPAGLLDGMAFNLVNLAVLLFLVSAPHTRLMRQPQTSNLSGGRAACRVLGGGKHALAIQATLTS